MMRVTVWNEFIHERKNPLVQAHYPNGIHTALVDGLRERVARRIDDVTFATATLDQPDHGLQTSVLDETDVLLWWGHLAHDKVSDDVVAHVKRRVLDGMGLLVLHSAHLSKIFRTLMGSSCNLRWREADDRELVWTIDPAHPIVQGVPQPIILDEHEMYGEVFDIPAPDELVFVSSFSGGEVFRSGCCFHRGGGRIFYFSPGHETYPIYHQPEILDVLANAISWAYREPVEKVDPNLNIGESPNAPTGWFESE